MSNEKILFYNDVILKNYRLTYQKDFYGTVKKGDYIFKIKKRKHKFGDFKINSWDVVVEKAKIKKYKEYDYYYLAINNKYKLAAIEKLDSDCKYIFVNPESFYLNKTKV